MTRARIAGAAALVLLFLTAGATQARAGDGKAALRLIPAKASIVFAINADRARKAPIYQDLMDLIAKSTDSSNLTSDLKKKAGFDIDKDLKTMVVGMPADAQNTERFYVVIEGRFNRGKIAALARKEGAKKQTHRGITYWANKDDAEMAFLGKNLLVLTKAGDMKGVIDVHRKKARSVLGNKRVMRLINAGDTTKDFWAAMVFDAAMKKQMAAQTQQPVDAMMASIDLQKGLAAKIRMAMENPKDAKAFATTVRGGVKQAANDPMMAQLGIGGALAGMSIKQAGKHVDLGISFTPAELAAIKGLLGQFSP